MRLPARLPACLDGSQRPTCTACITKNWWQTPNFWCPWLTAEPRASSSSLLGLTETCLSPQPPQQLHAAPLPMDGKLQILPAGTWQPGACCGLPTLRHSAGTAKRREQASQQGPKHPAGSRGSADLRLLWSSCERAAALWMRRSCADKLQDPTPGTACSSTKESSTHEADSACTWSCWPASRAGKGLDGTHLANRLSMR